MRPAVHDLGDLRAITHQVEYGRNRCEIRQRDEVSGQVLALRQPRLVHIQHLLQLPQAVLEARLVRGSEVGEHALPHQVAGRWPEVVGARFKPLIHRRPFC